MLADDDIKKLEETVKHLQLENAQKGKEQNELNEKYQKLDDKYKKLQAKYNAFELKKICLEMEDKFKEHETVDEELKTKRTNEKKIGDLEEKCKSLQLINEANLREL